jgi:arabinofuranosyltransferase
MNSQSKYIFSICFGTIVFAALIIRLCLNETTFVDDSYIFLRMAENAVNGHGFVWNLNESPLEGYTSFLYFLINIIAVKFFSRPELFLQIFGITTSLVTIVFIYQLYNAIDPLLKTENLVTSILVSISPCFLYWSLAGMETSFYMMFLIFTTFIYIKKCNSPINYMVTGGLFAILYLIRPESLIFFIYALLFSTYQLFKEKNKSRWLLLLCMVFGFELIFAPYFIWHLKYFGVLFPNSYYAKVGGGIYQFQGGVSYLFIHGKKLFSKGWFILIPIMALFIFEKKKKEQVFLFGLAIISVLITVLDGGDHFDYARFLIPVLPLLLIPFPSSLKKAYSFFKNKINYTLFCFTIPIIILIVNIKNPMYSEFIFNPKMPLAVSNNNLEEGYNWQVGFIKMGKTLNRISKPAETIGVIPVGAIGYFSKIRILDMAGILNSDIAREPFVEKYIKNWRPGHNKGDGYYVLAHRPEYIQLVDYLTTSPQSVPGSHGLFFKSIIEIWNSPIFHSEYEFYPIKLEDGIYYNLYRRRN